MEEKALQNSKKAEFDFDEWCELAKKDPEGFEARRREVIEEAITSASPGAEKRLRQLQWRIDMERRRCKTPLMSCMKLFDMMWDHVHSERGLLYAIGILSEIASGNVPEMDDSRGGVPTAVLSLSGRAKGGVVQASAK